MKEASVEARRPPQQCCPESTRLLRANFAAVADLRWTSIADRIDTSGHLHGVSYRPGVNTDWSRYEHTPVTGCSPWGQGPYLLAAAQRADGRPRWRSPRLTP